MIICIQTGCEEAHCRNGSQSCIDRSDCLRSSAHINLRSPAANWSSSSCGETPASESVSMRWWSLQRHSELCVSPESNPKGVLMLMPRAAGWHPWTTPSASKLCMRRIHLRAGPELSVHGGAAVASDQMLLLMSGTWTSTTKKWVSVRRLQLQQRREVWLRPNQTQRHLQVLVFSREESTAGQLCRMQGLLLQCRRDVWLCPLAISRSSFQGE